MTKKIHTFYFFFLFIFVFTGCSNLVIKEQWHSSKKLMINSNQLQVGDIILKKKNIIPSSWFGHSSIVVKNNLVGEYPKINVGYCETGLLDWFYDDKKIIILRYKYFDETFKKEFLRNVNKYKGKIYKLSFNKYDINSFYCSKYIWLIYLETAEKLKYKLDFKKYKNQLYIYPYDFLLSTDFEIIKL